MPNKLHQINNQTKKWNEPRLRDQKKERAQSKSAKEFSRVFSFNVHTVNWIRTVQNVKFIISFINLDLEYSWSMLQHKRGMNWRWNTWIHGHLKRNEVKRYEEFKKTTTEKSDRQKKTELKKSNIWIIFRWIWEKIWNVPTLREVNESDMNV